MSLTIASLKNSIFGLSIIPHTWNNTNLVKRSVGDKVNIETDVIAKYIEKLISSKEDSNDKFSDEWFKKIGY